jgi:glycosyltransferase involved in cell wall biosynthesis
MHTRTALQEDPMGEATLVIATRNRRAELRNALRSALGQTVPLDILLMDDGSTDGTSAMVRREFPSVTVRRTEQSLGYIEQRNRGAELAATTIIFSIDDDAVFSTPHVVAETLTDFDHPRVGAVAIPFIDVHNGPQVRQRAPAGEAIYVTARFVGTAHALRRDLFLALGGYRAHLRHQGEEGDYCIRLLEAGYVTRLGLADPIHHFESSLRDWSRVEVLGRRNDVLYCWQNVPWPYFPVHLLGNSAKGLWWGFKVGRPWRMVRGLVQGYRACWNRECERRPVRRATYRLNRLLAKSGALPLTAIEPRLGPMRPVRSLRTGRATAPCL